MASHDLREQAGREDDLIATIGRYGKYQLALSVFTALTVAIHAWAMLVNKFLTYPVGHWCKMPGETH